MTDEIPTIRKTGLMFNDEKSANTSNRCPVAGAPSGYDSNYFSKHTSSPAVKNIVPNL